MVLFSFYYFISHGICGIRASERQRCSENKFASNLEYIINTNPTCHLDCKRARWSQQMKIESSHRKLCSPILQYACACMELTVATATRPTFKSFAFRVIAIKWNGTPLAIVGTDYLCFIFIAHSFVLYHCADVIYSFRSLLLLQIIWIGEHRRRHR